MAYSLTRIIATAAAIIDARIFNNYVDAVQPFLALNDSTFQLKRVRPFHPIPGIVSAQYCSIVSKEVVEKYGKNFWWHRCGTEPFQFRSWERDEQGKSLPYLDSTSAEDKQRFRSDLIMIGYFRSITSKSDKMSF